MRADRPMAAWASERPWLGIAWAAALGLALCLTVYDWEFLAGSSPFWSNRHDDRAQALIGWFAYVHDAWRFPLFWTKLLRYPDGVTIVFTDSIPVAALIAKSLRAWLPDGFHYLGLWMGLCVVLQSTAAWLALRAWGVASFEARTAGCLMALSMPMWLARASHVSLCSHFLLLAGLWLYARQNVGGARDTRVWLWWPLLVLALLVHVYLFAMLTAIWLAAMASSRLGGERRWRASAIELAGGVGLIATVLAVGGYAAGGKLLHPGGFYGRFSLNLLQPWHWSQSSILSPAGRPIDATGGQYEGYSYLGAGVLLLLAVCLVRGRPLAATLARRHAPLALACVALTLFAISNVVYWGDTKLFQFELPAKAALLAEQFRSSGRFVWPVAYLALIGGFAGVGRAVASRRARTAIFLTATVLQLADTRELRARDRVRARSVETPVLEAAFWDPLVAAHDRLWIFPDFFCAPPENRAVQLELQMHAARNGIPVNSTALARSLVDCASDGVASRSLRPRRGNLYVFLKPSFDDAFVRVRFPRAKDCREFAQGHVCSLQGRRRGALLDGSVD